MITPALAAAARRTPPPFTIRLERERVARMADALEEDAPPLRAAPAADDPAPLAPPWALFTVRADLRLHTLPDLPAHGLLAAHHLEILAPLPPRRDPDHHLPAPRPPGTHRRPHRPLPPRPPLLGLHQPARRARRPAAARPSPTSTTGPARFHNRPAQRPDRAPLRRAPRRRPPPPGPPPPHQRPRPPIRRSQRHAGPSIHRRRHRRAHGPRWPHRPRPP